MDKLVNEHFESGEAAWCQPLLTGGGRLERRNSSLRLATPPMARRMYTDAQIDDYHGLRRARFPWRPPVRLCVRARASHPAASTALPGTSAGKGACLMGTAGFGFWNNPFSLSGGVLASPNVVWFFYASPPSDMSLVPGLPGFGWKAATLNAGRIPSLLLAPAALGAVLLTKIPSLGRPVMATARRAVRASEALVAVDMSEWHTYEMAWQPEHATFWVDGREVLRAPDPPRGPLGFVAWMDNQYAVATPEGRFGFGLVDSAEEQWLELDEVVIEHVGQGR